MSYSDTHNYKSGPGLLGRNRVCEGPGRPARTSVRGQAQCQLHCRIPGHTNTPHMAQTQTRQAQCGDTQHQDAQTHRLTHTHVSLSPHQPLCLMVVPLTGLLRPCAGIAKDAFQVLEPKLPAGCNSLVKCFVLSPHTALNQSSSQESRSQTHFPYLLGVLHGL